MNKHNVTGISKLVLWFLELRTFTHPVFQRKIEGEAWLNSFLLMLNSDEEIKESIWRFRNNGQIMGEDIRR